MNKSDNQAKGVGQVIGQAYCVGFQFLRQARLRRARIMTGFLVPRDQVALERRSEGGRSVWTAA